jgi:hypothetical protein
MANGRDKVIKLLKKSKKARAVKKKIKMRLG